MKDNGSEAFAEAMRDQLRRNSHKGEWSDWNPSAEVLIEKIRRKALEVNLAVRGGWRTARILEFAADIGNYSQKLYEITARNAVIAAPNTTGETPTADPALT